MIPRSFGGERERIVGHRLLAPGLEGGVRVEAPGGEQFPGRLAIGDRIAEAGVAQVDGQRDESLHRVSSFAAGLLDLLVVVDLLDTGEGGVELLRGPRQSGFGKLGDGVVELGCGHWLGEGQGPEQRDARRRRRRLARRPEREDERQQTHDLSV